MKRQKLVFSNADQVLHLWANQSQSEARSANVFFNGLSCYSYGRHYELGRIMEYKGVKIAAINDRGYSVTTSKHIRKARQAVHNLMPAIGCKGDFSEQGIFAGLLSEQDNLINGVMRKFSEVKGHNLKDYTFDKCYFIDSIAAFNKKVITLNEPQLTLDVDVDLIEVYNEKNEELYKKYMFNTSPEGQTLAAAKQAKAQAEKMKALSTDIQDWKNGGTLKKSLRNLNFQLVRINGDKIQTSRGAEVPLVEARIFYTALIKGLVQPGTKIGHFTFDGLNNGIVKVGCHNLKLEDIKTTLENGV